MAAQAGAEGGGCEHRQQHPEERVFARTQRGEPVGGIDRMLEVYALAVRIRDSA